MNDKTLGMLGMARRANSVSLGHDAALESLKKGGAVLILTASDASKRLCDEFERLCGEKGVGYIRTGYTMAQTGACMGAKTTAVLSVNNIGFADRIAELIREDN